jgi:hypothetical protein
MLFQIWELRIVSPMAIEVILWEDYVPVLSLAE